MKVKLINKETARNDPCCFLGKFLHVLLCMLPHYPDDGTFFQQIVLLTQNYIFLRVQNVVINLLFTSRHKKRSDSVSSWDLVGHLIGPLVRSHILLFVFDQQRLF